MWIFLPNGFFSITQHDNRPNTLYVRGRVAGDLERHFPRAQVRYTPDRDYLCRTDLPRGEVEEVVSGFVRDLSYNSFKGSADPRRSPYLLRIWNTACDMQDDLLATADYA